MDNTETILHENKSGTVCTTEYRQIGSLGLCMTHGGLVRDKPEIRAHEWKNLRI
jgi:hypothetical protein